MRSGDFVVQLIDPSTSQPFDEVVSSLTGCHYVLAESGAAFALRIGYSGQLLQLLPAVSGCCWWEVSSLYCDGQEVQLNTSTRCFQTETVSRSLCVCVRVCVCVCVCACVSCRLCFMLPVCCGCQTGVVRRVSLVGSIAAVSVREYR
jgi:hypothetical protein